MKIGDSLVFIGENVEDDHFKNFTYGETYKIKDIFSDLPDGDLYGHHSVVLFENYKFGCLLIHINKYFLSLDNLRNNKINKII